LKLLLDSANFSDMTSEPEPVGLDEGEIRKALGDSDTSGVVLFVIALRCFGDGVMGDPEQGIEQMDPAEMWAELNSRYGAWVTEEGENKLNAIITGLEDGQFWRDPEVFTAVAMALFDGDLGDLVGAGFDSLNATEVLWAVTEMGMVMDTEEAPPFSHSVQRCVQDVFEFEQEDQEQNIAEVERAYVLVLDQLNALGIPMEMLRSLDEEYVTAVENFRDGHI